MRALFCKIFDELNSSHDQKSLEFDYSSLEFMSRNKFNLFKSNLGNSDKAVKSLIQGVISGQIKCAVCGIVSINHQPFTGTKKRGGED